jgi:hypothetical protein
VWLELLQRFLGIVDEREARGLAATILSPEAKDRDLVFVGLVELRELGAKFIFGNVGTTRVENITIASTPEVRYRIKCDIPAVYLLL